MPRLKKYIWPLVFLVLALAILWQALLPGYILGLDMVFTPHMPVLQNTDGFLNLLPVNFLLHWAGMIIPVWILQKLIFLALFFSIGYLAFCYLPLGQDSTARMFGALVYLANPFVYGRFMAGQWTHLAAYALLPVFIRYLLECKNNSNLKVYLKLFGSLFLISIFSIHFFMMAALILVIVMLSSLRFVPLAWHMLAKRSLREPHVYHAAGRWARNFLIGSLLFLLAASYWIVPALQRPNPVETHFNQTHFEVFSAGGYKTINPLLNIASLNGLWLERTPWADSFVWPQDFAVFWIAFIIIFAMAGLGAISLIKEKKNREVGIFFLALGVITFIFATGAGPGPFQHLNIWLYKHIFFWPGFRDSQKFLGFLALSYAALAAVGFQKITQMLNKVKPSIKDFIVSLAFIIPVLFGITLWGGLHNQIHSVWYPDSWTEARQILAKQGNDQKTLFLPWHGYFSFHFNYNLVSANPAEVFFGNQVIASRSIELPGIYDQEGDQSYRQIDFILTSPAASREQKLAVLKKNGITYVIFAKDVQYIDPLSYDFLDLPAFEKILEENNLVMYQIHYEGN